MYLLTILWYDLCVKTHFINVCIYEVITWYLCTVLNILSSGIGVRPSPGNSLMSVGEGFFIPFAIEQFILIHDGMCSLAVYGILHFGDAHITCYETSLQRSKLVVLEICKVNWMTVA